VSLLELLERGFNLLLAESARLAEGLDVGLGEDGGSVLVSHGGVKGVGLAGEDVFCTRR